MKTTTRKYIILSIAAILGLLNVVVPCNSKEEASEVASVDDYTITTDDLDSSVMAKRIKQRYIIEEHKIRVAALAPEIERLIWTSKAQANHMSVTDFKKKALDEYINSKSNDRLFELVNLSELENVQLIDGNLRLYIAQLVRELFNDQNQVQYAFNDALKKSIEINLLKEVLEEFRHQSDIEIHEIPWDFPINTRITVSTNGALMMGPENAHVVVDLYSGFDSPLSIYDIYRHARENRISLRIHPLPLQTNPGIWVHGPEHTLTVENTSLAKAFYCANQQGKFDDMFSNYFGIEGSWDSEYISDKIEELTINTNVERQRFNECLGNQMIIQKIDMNKKTVDELEPNGTKALVVINGIAVDLNDPIVAELINHELKK